jgi:hypothetical protein
MQLQIHQTRSRQRQMGTRDRHSSAIPHSMEAAAIDHFGPAEVVTLHVLPVPSCDADEVLIALDTAGVGPGTRTSAMAGFQGENHNFHWCSASTELASLPQWGRGYVG